MIGGSKINGVSINISSGSITIGNSTYALAIPVKRFYTEVLGNGTVNSSTSILLDLSSVVVPYFPNHSNATESFAFMPKLSSVLGYVNKLQMPGNMAGAANKAFEENESMPLDEFGRNAAFLRSISSVKVANASISRSGGNEDLSISLINTGNNIAIVEGVAILSCFFIPDYAISSGMRHGGHGNATTYNAGCYGHVRSWVLADERGHKLGRHERGARACHLLHEGLSGNRAADKERPV